jgi:hypothetical protein
MLTQSQRAASFPTGETGARRIDEKFHLLRLLQHFRGSGARWCLICHGCDAFQDLGRNSPLTASNIKLTVQLAPANVRTPRDPPVRITSAFTGSRTVAVWLSIRSVEAASIQYSFHPLRRSGRQTSDVYFPPWQVIKTSHVASACYSGAFSICTLSPAFFGAGLPIAEVKKI